MDYDFDLSIPANTPESDPVTVEFKVPAGMITRVRIMIPEGCFGLVHVRIMHYEYQVWPSNPGEWYEGDGVQIEFDESYRLEEDWNPIRIEGYNEDDTYDHTIRVGLSVQPPSVTWGEGFMRFLATLAATGVE